MDDREKEIQERLHSAISEVLQELDEDDGLVTGWVLCFERLSPDDNAAAGHLYGPQGFTTWRALGLLEWVRRFCLHPDEVDGDDG